MTLPLLRMTAVLRVTVCVEATVFEQKRYSCSRGSTSNNTNRPPHGPFLPVIGGAMRLAGSTDVIGCSFLSNSVSSRGLAIALVQSANISNSAFDGNDLLCTEGSYRSDQVTEK